MDEKCIDAVVEAVRTDLLQRSQFGLKKYGTTLSNSGLSLREYLQHAYEEALDHANYLKGAIMELDKQVPQEQENVFLCGDTVTFESIVIDVRGDKVLVGYLNGERHWFLKERLTLVRRVVS